MIDVTMQVPVWDQKIEIKICENEDEALRELNIDMGSYNACFDTTRGYLVIVKGNIELGFIVHESIHAANWIFENIGLVQDVKNDEAVAYTAQYIFDRIVGYMRKNNVHFKVTKLQD